MPQAKDHVSISIGKELSSLSSSPFHKPSIFKLDHYMDHNISKNLLVPKLVSIGPIHHGTDHLQKMEHHKLRYVNWLLKRQNESGVGKYVMAIQELAEKARKCYADQIYLNTDEFVKMLFLDGCFIIEFIRKRKFHHLRESGDDIFYYSRICRKLVQDFMLVENQIPFFILEKLFKMTKSENPEDDLIPLIQFVVGNDYMRPNFEKLSSVAVPTTNVNVDHLLGLMYSTWSSSWAEEISGQERTDSGKLDINSVTKAREAGIRFEKDKGSNNLLAIKYSDGAIKIPSLVISDDTELVLRNLILYEYIFIDDYHPKYVTDYAFFMQCLINSRTDVELLRVRGIFSNLLGDDDMVQHMFRYLTKNAMASSIFSYVDVFDGVNKHCRRRRNRWMANLWHNYFHSPWAFISFLGAVILLLLTLTQTVFTILR